MIEKPLGISDADSFPLVFPCKFARGRAGERFRRLEKNRVKTYIAIKNAQRTAVANEIGASLPLIASFVFPRIQ